MNPNPILEKKGFKYLEKFMYAILIVTGIIIVLLVTAYVVCRYVFKISIYGFEDICLLTVMWMYFIGSANASKEQSHITADMLELFVHNPNVLKYVVLVRRIVCLVVISIMAYLGFDFMKYNAEHGMTTVMTHIPMIFYHLALFIGFLLMALYDLVHLINDIKNLRNTGTLEGKGTEA